MKKLIVFGLILAVLGLGRSAVANTPETAILTPAKLPSSIIDGIEVPFEVLDYAQMKYQGYAVTQVTRSFRDGQQAYQLRVDNDDILYDDDCISLWYDMNWKLIAEGQAPARLAPSYEQIYQSQPEQPGQQETPSSPPHRERKPIESPEPPQQPEDEPEDDDEDEFPPRGRGRRNN